MRYAQPLREPCEKELIGKLSTNLQNGPSRFRPKAQGLLRSFENRRAQCIAERLSVLSMHWVGRLALWRRAHLQQSADPGELLELTVWREVLSWLKKLTSERRPGELTPRV